MRILVLNTGYFPVPPISASSLIGGSIELHTYYLANELANLGNEVHYVTSVSSGASFASGVTVHKLPNLSICYSRKYAEVAMNFAIGGFLSFAAAIKELGERTYDIVHAHGNISAGLLYPLMKKSKRIFTVHNRTPWMMKSATSVVQALRQTSFYALDMRAIKNADRVITVSENLRKELIDHFKVDPEKTRAIPNGVDLKLFRPSIPHSEAIRIEYGIDSDYALFVGRLVEEKAVDIMIRAIADTGIHLVIAGDGPMLPYLKDLARQLKVDQRVHFLGPVPREKLPSLYSQAALSVLPSMTEVGSSLSGLEAMASGLPVVASYASGAHGVVRHGYNGFVIDSRNIELIREKLVQLSKDAALRELMGRRSRQIAMQDYSWQETAKQTLHVYEEVLRR